MARSLGIYLQPDGWSFALLDGNSRKWSLRAHEKGVVESTDRPRRNLSAALSKGFKRASGKVDQVVLSIPSSGSVLRELSVPFSDREKIQQILKFEVESDLYHLDIDDVVCDFIELADERATSTLLVASTPKDFIQDGLDVLSRAGMDPQTVELDLGALATAVSAHEISEQDGSQVFLHVGAHTTLLLVASAEGLQAARSLSFGWSELISPNSDSIAELESETEVEEDTETETEKPTDEEESGRTMFGLATGNQPASFEEAIEGAEAEAYDSFLRRLVGDVRRGLSAVPNPPTTLHLLGEELPLLCEKLSGKLGIPANPLALGLASGSKNEDEAIVPPDPVALGAALRGLGSQGSEMDLRQEEFRYARGVERVSGALTLMLVGLLAWLLVDSVILFRKTQSLQQRTDELYERAADFIDQLNDGLPDQAPDAWKVRTRFSDDFRPLDRMPNLRNRLMRVKRDLDEMVGEAGIELPQSCLNAWDLLSVVMERELGERFDGRWMLESLEFVSVDKKTRNDAHVLATVAVTIFSDGQDTDLHRFEALSGALQAQPWCIGTPETPGGFKATKDNEPGTRSGTIKVKIDTTKAREEKA